MGMEIYIDSLSFLLLSIILLQLRTTKDPREPRKDRLFRHFICASIIFHGISLATHLCTAITSPVPGCINLFLSILHVISFPTITYVWFIYALSSISYKKQRNYHRHLLAFFIPLTLFCLLAIADALFLQGFEYGADNHPGSWFGTSAVQGICLLYTLLAFITVLVCRKRIPRYALVMFLLSPLAFSLSIFLFAYNGYLLFNVTVTFVGIGSYVNLLNRKLTYDPFTGLLNQRAFQNRLEQYLSRGETGCILIVDLENFKYFNERYGRSKGNELLHKLVLMLQNLNPDSLVFRYGGDQFVMILNGYTTARSQQVVADLRKIVDSPWRFDDVMTHISMHIGIVCYPEQFTTAEEVMAAVESTLQEVKTHQRGKTVVYDHTLLERQKRKIALTEAVRSAIQSNSLRVFLQPIYNAASGRITSAEALLRLQDELLGSVMPAEFIPIAEETGTIIEITYWVLQRVCGVWNQIKPVGSNLEFISINLSAVNFLQPSMEQDILAILNQNHIEAHRIQLELTESVMVDSFERVKEVMGSLSAKGISFALDDYGSGYSNINYLIHLPFSTVKLDRSLILHAEEQPILLESIALMLQKQEKRTVAEGVETSGQLDIVRASKIDAVQGYIFSRALPEDQFLNLLESKNSINSAPVATTVSPMTRKEPTRRSPQNAGPLQYFHHKDQHKLRYRRALNLFYNSIK